MELDGVSQHGSELVDNVCARDAQGIFKPISKYHNCWSSNELGLLYIVDVVTDLSPASCEGVGG